jgi:hypothetical protein
MDGIREAERFEFNKSNSSFDISNHPASVTVTRDRPVDAAAGYSGCGTRHLAVVITLTLTVDLDSSRTIACLQDHPSVRHRASGARCHPTSSSVTEDDGHRPTCFVPISMTGRLGVYERAD